MLVRDAPPSGGLHNLVTLSAVWFLSAAEQRRRRWWECEWLQRFVVHGPCGTNATSSAGNWAAEDTTANSLHTANRVEFIISLEQLMPIKHDELTRPCAHVHWKCYWTPSDEAAPSLAALLICFYLNTAGSALHLHDSSSQLEALQLRNCGFFYFILFIFLFHKVCGRISEGWVASGVLSGGFRLPLWSQLWRVDRCGPVDVFQDPLRI